VKKEEKVDERETIQCGVRPVGVECNVSAFGLRTQGQGEGGGVRNGPPTTAGFRDAVGLHS